MFEKLKVYHLEMTPIKWDCKFVMQFFCPCLTHTKKEKNGYSLILQSHLVISLDDKQHHQNNQKKDTICRKDFIILQDFSTAD